MKIKHLVSFALAMGILTISSISSFAATKVYFDPYYTGTNVGSILHQERSITGSGVCYFARCTSSTGGCKITIDLNGEDSTTIGAGQEDLLDRDASSNGNIDIYGDLVHYNTSGGVQASSWKIY